LSDGIFAVALTLLVLDLHAPVMGAIQGKGELPLWASGALYPEGVLLGALAKLAPNLLTYLMSFLTLGIFWIGQQTQLNHFARGNRTLAWIHLVFLLAVSLMPFSTGLLARYINYRVALGVYWFNIFLLGAMLFVSWQYAQRANLLKDEANAEVRTATEKRIIIAQALYAFGALLCIFNTYVSIGFIVLVQLNYVIAPRIGQLHHI
jgi:uncharacterized membrane protein